MLARLWRLLAWSIVAPTAWLTRAIADTALVARARLLAEDLRIEQQRRLASDDMAVRLKADLEHALAWRDREITTLRAEADANRAKSILSKESTERE